MPLSKHSKQYKLFSLVIFALTAATIITLIVNPSMTTPSLIGDTDLLRAEATDPVVADFWQKPAATLAADSRAPAASIAPGADEDASAPALDYASIEEQLLKIKVDENGDAILDRDANNRIAAGFHHVPLPLNPKLIEDLQQTITQSLPSPLGSQVAEIVAGYHDYLVAVKEELALFGSPQNFNEHKQRLQQKIALQALILGESTAQKLFAQENADQMYMLEGMEVATNPDLTPKQRDHLLAKLERQREQLKPAINNWDLRYEQFERNREAIEDAALSTGDKTQQIRSLYRQSFDMAERAQIEEMGALSLN